jgi:hypothetical protein
MKIKYEIEEYEPEREYILLKFTSPDNPDWQYYKSLNPPDFSKEKLEELIAAVGSVVTGFWNRAQAHKSECPIPMTGEMDVEPEVYMAQEIHTRSLPQPEFDDWTEYLVAQDITSPFQETVGWDIVKYTEEEAEQQYLHMEMGCRFQRNDYLFQSDFINFPDARIANVQEWLEYRQYLRDLPETPGWPKNIKWPERPEIVKEPVE